MSFQVVAIPLCRSEIKRFLSPPQSAIRGNPVQILDQRPTRNARSRWLKVLRHTPNLYNLLSIHHPSNNIVTSYTDRLVPAEFLLSDEDYLNRNLGGWTPIYFAVMDFGIEDIDDPLLKHTQILTNYGTNIRFYGEDPGLVYLRLQKEFDLELPELINLSIDIYSLLGNTDQSTTNWKEDARSAMSLYQMLDDCKAKHQSMILDALLEALVRVEQTRRKSVASNQQSIVDEIKRWQDDLRSQTGLILILKGEYIMGRHRRSTILIAPEMGVVIKQPGPEPFHEVKLAAKYYDGKPENWPILTEDGALVTPAGRIRIIFEQGLVEMLNNTFDHPMELNTLLGVTLEPYEPGPTMQTYVLEQPANLNTELYEQVVIHQLVAEQLGVENGDWHSANFIVRSPNELVHIDWGAARILEPHEKSAQGEFQRLEQVQNIAFSFHDPEIAQQVLKIHQAIIASPKRVAKLKLEAKKFVTETKGNSNDIYA